MNLLLWSAVLIVAIFPCDGQLKSLAPIDLLSCPNQTHDVPLFSSKHLPITFDRTELRQKGIHTVRVHASIVDGKVAEFRGHGQTVQKVFHLDRNDDVDGSANIVHDFELHAKYINRTYIRYSVETINGRNQSRFSNCTTVLMISQPQRWLDKIFKGSIPFIVIFISVQMGMLLDIEALKEIMRRPVQIVIGFVCQYGFMPLIAFGISKIFRYDPLYGLGLFVVGCCPGGSASNQWTVMFDGDLNLSAFMSFASTVASFFMMPLWLYTLGQYAYLRELKLRIPFVNLAQSLLTIIGPLGIGMLIIHFFPKLKPLVQRVVKPILLMLIIYFTVFGAFVNWYLFLYIDLRTALTAPFLPWLGFLLGGFFAWVCGQDPKRIVTIGIETGIQNVGIAFMVLLYSFPAPQNSQASVIPLIVAYLSTQPFYLILLYRLIRRKCGKSKPSEDPTSTVTLEKTSEQLSKPEEQPLDSNALPRKLASEIVASEI